MQQWDRERTIAMEAREEGRSEGRAEGRAEAIDETTKKDALEVIYFGRDNGVSDEKIRQGLVTRFNLKKEDIDELFTKADAQ